MRIALLIAAVSVVTAFLLADLQKPAAAQPIEGLAVVHGSQEAGDTNLDNESAESAAPAGLAQGKWWRQNSTTRSTLRDVSFVDYRYGWAVGGERDDDCVIVATADGGRKWARQGCPLARRLEAVDFVDRSNGWAVGMNGTILRTHDGGANWGRQGINSKSTLTAIDAWDTNVVYVASRDGSVHKSNNGGANWHLLATSNTYGLFGLSFVDPNNGWAVGSNGTVLGTQDGGVSWKRLHFSGDDRLLGVSFVDHNVGWAVGNDIYVTHQGGNGWGAQSNLTKTMEDVHAIDGRNVWVAGDEGIIGKTTDGTNWVRDGEGMTTRGLRAIHFVDTYDGWVVGTGGLVLHYALPRPTDTPRVTNTPVATNTPLATNTPTPTPTLTPSPTPTPSGPWVYAGPPGDTILVPEGSTATVRVVYGNMPAPTDFTVTVEGPVELGDGGLQTIEVPAYRKNGWANVEVTATEGAAPGTEFTFVAEKDDASSSRRGVIAYSIVMPMVIDR